jgi:hypothetical protein
MDWETLVSTTDVTLSVNLPTYGGPTKVGVSGNLGGGIVGFRPWADIGVERPHIKGLMRQKWRIADVRCAPH